MFKKLFQRKNQQPTLSTDALIQPEFVDDGILFPSLYNSDAYQNNTGRKLKCYLEQLEEEGILVAMQQHAFIDRKSTRLNSSH